MYRQSISIAALSCTYFPCWKLAQNTNASLRSLHTKLQHKCFGSKTSLQFGNLCNSYFCIETFETWNKTKWNLTQKKRNNNNKIQTHTSALVCLNSCKFHNRIPCWNMQTNRAPIGWKEFKTKAISFWSLLQNF